MHNNGGTYIIMESYIKLHMYICSWKPFPPLVRTCVGVPSDEFAPQCNISMQYMHTAAEKPFQIFITDAPAHTYVRDVR